MSARKRNRIFILGGGASLGAHQVGALKRLEEDHPELVTQDTPTQLVGTGISEPLRRSW